MIILDIFLATDWRYLDCVSSLFFQFTYILSKARFDVMSKYEVDDPLKDISSKPLSLKNEEEPTIQFEGASETTFYELFMVDFENYQYLEIYNSG